MPRLPRTHWRQSRDPQPRGARGRAPSLDLPLGANSWSGRQRPGAFHARLALRVSVSDDDGRTAGAGRLRRLSGVRRLPPPGHALRARSSARRRLLAPRPRSTAGKTSAGPAEKSEADLDLASAPSLESTRFHVPLAGTVLALAASVYAPAPQYRLSGAGPRRTVPRASSGPSHGVPRDARPSMSRTVRAVLMRRVGRRGVRP